MSDTIDRLDTGAIMSQAAVHGGIVYLAGQVADDATASMEEQTAQVLAKIDALLQRTGSDRTRIISALVHIADAANFGGLNTVWTAWMPEGHAPVRTTVVAAMARPGLMVEITVVAALAA